jgi:hypothetical protein
MSKPPVHTILIGYIKAAIWRNETKHGDSHMVTVCRLYRNGDKWVESTRFGRDDLLALAKVVDQAHTWITSSANADES